MADCPVCKEPIQVFKVYKYKKKKFVEMKGACVPCYEKERSLRQIKKKEF